MMASGDVRASPGGIGVSLGDIEEKSLMVSSEPLELENPVKKGLFFFLLLMILGGWIVLSPGVYTIPPTEGYLDGVTIIYVDKPSNVPFFSSPDFFCLEQTGGVSYRCRQQVIQASSDLIQREFVRIPYVQWTYTESTGGILFEP